MERRALLAVVLSFAVLYAYQAFFLPASPPPQKPRTGQAAKPAPTPPAAATVPTSFSQQNSPVIGESGEHELAVETGDVRAVFTNRGARLKHWVLKKYHDPAGRFVDLVPQDLPLDQPLPFSLRIDEGGITSIVNNALFRAMQSSTPSGDQQVAFEFEDTSGLKARKEFRLGAQPYVLTVAVDVQQGSRELTPYVQWGPGPGDLGATGGGGFFKRDVAPPPEALFHDGADVKRIASAKIAEQPVHEGAFRFAGIDDHYFIVAAVNPGQARVEYRELSLPIPNDAERRRQLLLHTLRLPRSPTKLKYYIGPKSFDALKAVDGEFVRAINFGIWAWLAVPFLSILKWIYGYVGNYGWAIIVLTILMNIVIFPLRHKSVVSMRKMQELQPQLKAIQDRYAGLKMNDPGKQKMNTEMMNLYREKGVNPASGCIPMVLTFPVLFAFYSLLSQAIELRGAPFGLWIQDLSQHDPYYVTPLLMGATMFWQQKITPTTADPAQQRMMMFMPVVFVAMFLTFPSGLAIYYFVNNVWAIGQQYFTNWMFGPPPTHVARPAAERRLKTVGSGRTQRAEKNS